MPQAQHTAQDAQQADLFMPGAGYGETLRDVIEDHGLSHTTVARGTGLSRTSITRILLGQHNVPPELTRWLWKRTADPRVIEVALGDDYADRMIDAGPDTDRGIYDRRSGALLACGIFNTTALSNGETDKRLVPVITRAIEQLADYKRALESAPGLAVPA